jgi:hypothetical protein
MEHHQIAESMLQRWSTKKLADLHAEALREANGTAFDAIKANGTRAIVFICVTDQRQIEQLEHAIKFSEDTPPCDWQSKKLMDLFLATDSRGGLSYEDLRGNDGKRTAVTLCATRPNRIQLLEVIFAFPA